MPDHPVALEILERTGPLAVSSANISGEPAAISADQAEEMLGDAVSVIVDAGESPGELASTIVDATGPHGRTLRAGSLSLDQLNEGMGRPTGRERGGSNVRYRGVDVSLKK